MVNEDQHLRDRDEIAQDLLIKRIEQAHRNADEWFIRSTEASRRGEYELAGNLWRQGHEELKHHGH